MMEPHELILRVQAVNLTTPGQIEVTAWGSFRADGDRDEINWLHRSGDAPQVGSWIRLQVTSTDRPTL